MASEMDFLLANLRARHILRKTAHHAGKLVLFREDGEASLVEDGGPGSGNWGHEGRKGKVGGSAKGGGVHNRRTAENGEFTSFSKKQKTLAKAHTASSGEFHNLPNKTKIVCHIPDYGKVTYDYDAKSMWFNGSDGSQMTADDLTDACSTEGVTVRTLIPKEASPNYNKARYSPKRLAEAKFFTDQRTADKEFRSATGAIWKGLSDREKKSLYDYTGGFFSSINSSLRKGHGTVENETKASDITNAIAKSKTKQDMWLYRGIGTDALPSMFNVDFSNIDGSKISSLVGKSGSDNGFMSCGTTSGTGYGDIADVNLKVFVPKGSEALYAEPFSKYGANPDSFHWNGESDQAYFSSEMETILQRGSRFQCTKASYDEDTGKYDIEIAVTGQEYGNLNW